MKSSDIYNNNKILKLLLNNNIPSLRIVILFFSIFLVGYILNSIDDSLIIKSGDIKFVLPLDHGKGGDTVRIADNTLFIDTLSVNNKKIEMRGKLLNDNLVNQKPTKIDSIKFSTTLVRNSLDSLSGSKDIIITARNLSFYFKISPITAEVYCKLYGIGYLEDIGNYLILIAFMIIIYLLKKLSESFVYAFTGIKSNDSPEAFDYNEGLLKVVKFYDEQQKEEFEKSFIRAFDIIGLKNSKARKIYLLVYTILILIALWMSFSLIYNKINWNFSWKFYPLGFISNQIKDIFLFAIILPPILIRVTLIAYFTIKFSKYFNNSRMFLIRPLSPDRAGGLAPLGEVTLYLFYMSISFFPNLFTTSLILGYPFIHKILYPFYFMFTFYLFYFPLSAPHKSMKIARHSELTKISDKYNTIYNKFIHNNEVRNNLNKTVLDELKDVSDLYNQTRKMPVWPFDFEIFVKFGAVFLSSMLAYLGQLLIALIK